MLTVPEDARPHPWCRTDDASHPRLAGGGWSRTPKMPMAYNDDERGVKESSAPIGISV